MTEETLDIIVVDDDDEIRDVIRITLETKGFKVRTAKNGVEALTEIERSIPDVFISDIEMPELDGLHLIEEIREREEWCSIPVIMVSGLTSDSKRSELSWARDLHVQAFIGKPFNPMKLLEAMENIMDKRKKR